MRFLTSLLLSLVLLVGQAAATKNVIVVLDDSGSMNEPMAKQNMTRMLAAKRALRKVLEILPDDTHVGVVLLNGRIDGDAWVIPLGPVDMGRVDGLISQVEAGGGTPLGKFMKVGADALLEARKKDHYGSYRLLLVTDGEANDEELVDRFLPDILSRGLTVDVIGVDMAETHSLATRVHSYRQADNPDSLTEAVPEVFAETSTDENDTGESDFELLEAFPDGMAVAALGALTAGGDLPIGALTADDSNSANRRGNSSHSGRGNRRQQKRKFSIFTLAIVLFVVLNVVGKLMRATSRR
jgi:uncharacterized protein YegL